jgi:hypothetical protein
MRSESAVGVLLSVLIFVTIAVMMVPSTPIPLSFLILFSSTLFYVVDFVERAGLRRGVIPALAVVLWTLLFVPHLAFIIEKSNNYIISIAKFYSTFVNKYEDITFFWLAPTLKSKLACLSWLLFLLLTSFYAMRFVSNSNRLLLLCTAIFFVISPMLYWFLLIISWIPSIIVALVPLSGLNVANMPKILRGVIASLVPLRRAEGGSDILKGFLAYLCLVSVAWWSLIPVGT